MAWRTLTQYMQMPGIKVADKRISKVLLLIRLFNRMWYLCVCTKRANEFITGYE